jgi:hypothetical protein
MQMALTPGWLIFSFFSSLERLRRMNSPSGRAAGLDFASSPPVRSISSMSTTEGCSSIADAQAVCFFVPAVQLYGTISM